MQGATFDGVRIVREDHQIIVFAAGEPFYRSVEGSGGRLNGLRAHHEAQQDSAFVRAPAQHHGSCHSADEKNAACDYRNPRPDWHVRPFMKVTVPYVSRRSRTLLL